MPRRETTPMAWHDAVVIVHPEWVHPRGECLVQPQTQTCPRLHAPHAQTAGDGGTGRGGSGGAGGGFDMGRGESGSGAPEGEKKSGRRVREWKKDPEEEEKVRKQAEQDAELLGRRLAALEDGPRVRETCESLCLGLWEQIAARRRQGSGASPSSRPGDARVAQALPRVRLAGAASEAELRRLLAEGRKVDPGRVAAVADALGAALTSLLTQCGRMLYRLDEDVATVDDLDWRTLQEGSVTLSVDYLRNTSHNAVGMHDTVESAAAWEPAWGESGAGGGGVKDALLGVLRERYGDPVAGYAAALAADAARFPDVSRPGRTRFVLWMPRAGRAGACAYGSPLDPARPGADALEAVYPGLVPNTVQVLEHGHLTGVASIVKALVDAAGEWTAHLPELSDGETRLLADRGALDVHDHADTLIG